MENALRLALAPTPDSIFSENVLLKHWPRRLPPLPGLFDARLRSPSLHGTSIPGPQSDPPNSFEVSFDTSPLIRSPRTRYRHSPPASRSMPGGRGSAFASQGHSSSKPGASYLAPRGHGNRQRPLARLGLPSYVIWLAGLGSPNLWMQGDGHDFRSVADCCGFRLASRRFARDLARSFEGLLPHSASRMLVFPDVLRPPRPRTAAHARLRTLKLGARRRGQRSARPTMSPMMALRSKSLGV
jgi:hypothetical protein